MPKQKKPHYFANLDALRGVAILLVLLHHSTLVVPGLGLLKENGRYGVDLFFCISGFLICYLFLAEIDKRGAIDLPYFFVKRVSRLLPLYYATLLLYCAIIYGVREFSPENRALFTYKLPSYLFFYSNMIATATTGPFFFAWSLAVEEQFYLLFGNAMRYVSKERVRAGLVVLLLVKIVYFNGLAAGIALPLQWERIVFSYREPILLGVLLAFLFVKPTFLRNFKLLFSSPAACGLLLLLWLAVASLHVFHIRSAWDTQLFYLLTTLLVGSAAVSDSVPLLSSLFFLHLGRISYGVYLFHMLYINALKRIVNVPPVDFPLVILLCFVVNTLVFRYFETPITQYGRKWRKS